MAESENIRLIVSSIAGNSISRQRNSLLLSLFNENQLVSRAELIRRDVTISGRTYKTLGVCGVLTLPPFRKQGHGRRLMAAITAHISASDADIGMLFCRVELSRFYAATNWLPAVDGTTRIGTPNNYRPYKLQRMMIFVSENAVKEQLTISAQPCYLESAW